jgi:hypothetical protein
MILIIHLSSQYDYHMNEHQLPYHLISLMSLRRIGSLFSCFSLVSYPLSRLLFIVSYIFFHATTLATKDKAEKQT